MVWLNGIEKLALNIPPYDTIDFDPNYSGFVNEILFVRDSGVTETSTGSPTGYIYLNGIKYGDGLDTYINSIVYHNNESEEHPFSLEIGYINGVKETFYVPIDDIATLSGKVDVLNERVVIGAEYLPYSATTSVAVLQLYFQNGNVQNVNVTDIDYIIENYQPREDEGLLTDEITISGAINEVYNYTIENALNIYNLSGQLNSANEKIEQLEQLVENAYIDADYDPTAKELSLIKLNGEITILNISAGGGSGHCNCCCPIVEIMSDGDSWIQKLGRRVTALENIIYNMSGDIEVNTWCVNDLEKRVMTLENEVNLDDRYVWDYTTIPPTSAYLDGINATITASVSTDKYPYAYQTDAEGNKNYDYFEYINLSIEKQGQEFNIPIIKNDDADVSLTDFGITKENFDSAIITKNNGDSIATISYLNLQSYTEDLQNDIKQITANLLDDTKVTIQVKQAFNLVGLVKEGLAQANITETTFDRLLVEENGTTKVYADFNESVVVIIECALRIADGESITITMDIK